METLSDADQIHLYYAIFFKYHIMVEMLLMFKEKEINICYFSVSSQFNLKGGV